ncbi:MAG: hypothetical protein QF894_12815 [Alphaproteobacteria bacterium]|jgi:hypothetical protein|nr:hypothetical protein [Alphaproteobacteria bacterium]
MPSEYQSNAMTEIALALAMAFFSIMVLAMLSMGSALQVESAAAPGLAEGIRLSLPAAASGVNDAAPARQVAADEVIVHWRGRFFDGALKPLDPAALAAGGRRVLAIAPDLSIAEAMAVREMIATAQLEVTTLDSRWMQTLEEQDP